MSQEVFRKGENEEPNPQVVEIGQRFKLFPNAPIQTLDWTTGLLNEPGGILLKNPTMLIKTKFDVALVLLELDDPEYIEEEKDWYLKDPNFLFPFNVEGGFGYPSANNSSEENNGFYDIKVRHVPEFTSLGTQVSLDPIQKKVTEEYYEKRLCLRVFFPDGSIFKCTVNKEDPNLPGILAFGLFTPERLSRPLASHLEGNKNREYLLHVPKTSDELSLIDAEFIFSPV